MPRDKDDDQPPEPPAQPNLTVVQFGKPPNWSTALKLWKDKPELRRRLLQLVTIVSQTHKDPDDFETQLDGIVARCFEKDGETPLIILDSEIKARSEASIQQSTPLDAEPEHHPTPAGTEPAVMSTWRRHLPAWLFKPVLIPKTLIALAAAAGYLAHSTVVSTVKGQFSALISVDIRPEEKALPKTHQLSYMGEMYRFVGSEPKYVFNVDNHGEAAIYICNSTAVTTTRAPQVDLQPQRPAPAQSISLDCALHPTNLGLTFGTARQLPRWYAISGDTLWSDPFSNDLGHGPLKKAKPEKPTPAKAK